MQIIILGSSRIAISLALRLKQTHDVVIAGENIEEKLSQAGIDIVCFNGNIIDTDVLIEAGIKECDCVCAMSEKENSNLVAAQLAKKMFNVRKVISLVYDTREYRIFEEWGVVPISINDITVDAFYKEVGDNFTMEKGQVGTSDIYRIFGREMKFKLFETEPSMINTKLKYIAETEGGFVLGVVRDGDIINYDPNLRIQNGDRVMTAVLLD